MSSKLLLFFLGAFLLVQCSLGKAIPAAEASTDEETAVSALKPDTGDVPEQASDKLLFYVLTKFSKIGESTLKTGKKLLQDFVADVSALEDKNEEITAKLEEFSNLLNELENFEDEDTSDEFIGTIELLIELVTLLDKSNVTLIEEPTSSDNLIQELLEKNGLSNLEQHFEENFEETFSEEFYEAVERILNSATAEEWSRKIDIQKWLEGFKLENDSEKKIEMLEQFFNFYI